MAARIGVVRFDDVAEEQRRSTVCVRQLERMVDADLAFVCEQLEQAEQGKHRRNRPRVVERGKRREQADGCEGGVDEKRETHEAQLRPRRHAPRVPIAAARGHEVDAELRGERDDVDGPVVDLRRPVAGGEQHDDRSEGMPRVDGGKQEAVGEDPSADDVECARQRGRGADNQGRPRQRREEEDRNENDLCRHRVSGPHLELDPGCERVGDDERRDRHGGRASLRGHEGDERCGDGEEADRPDDGGRERSAAESARVLLALVLDQALDGGVELRGRVRRRRRRRRDGRRRSGHPTGNRQRGTSA